MAVLLGVRRTDEIASLLANFGYSLAVQTSDFGNLWIIWAMAWRRSVEVRWIHISNLNYCMFGFC
jgi:hypothetical protein